MEELLLPLFPLELVLLPGELLPLHIFEDRYKQMISDCLEGLPSRDREQDFGVVLAKDQEVATVGCAAAVTQIIRRYEDGRMDILTQGRRRFEILFTDEGKSYLRGGVQFFQDEPKASTARDAETAHALELLQEVLKRVSGPQAAQEMPSKPFRQLSFQIGAMLPLALEFKQHLLTLRNEGERLQEIIRAMEEMIPALDLAAKNRQKASGNGHLRPHE
jgi:Lon protease-like protein